MAALVLMLVLATTAYASTEVATNQLTSSVVKMVNYVIVADAESAKLASAQEGIESIEAADPSAVSEVGDAIEDATLNTPEIICQHNYPSLSGYIAEVLSAEQSNSNIAAYQSTLEKDEAVIKSLLTSVNQYDLENFSTFEDDINELQQIAAKYPSATTLISYIEAIELTEPSVISAVQVIQQLKDSSPLLISYVNLVESQPSALTDPTYFDSIENDDPSLFDAFAELSAADEIHSTLSTVMSTVERLDSWFPNLLSVVSNVQQVISSSTMHMVSELESLESSYPSLEQYIRQMSQSTSSATENTMSTSMNMDVNTNANSASQANVAAVQTQMSLPESLESIEQVHPSLPSLLSSMKEFSSRVSAQAQTMPAKKCSSMQVDVEIFS